VSYPIFSRCGILMIKLPRDEVITTFPAILAIDACAVWNILCSQRLTVAAKCGKRHFVLAEYVRYECLVKPRKKPLTEIEIAHKCRLNDELQSGKHFSSCSLEVEDLVNMMNTLGAVNLKRFHQGEFAALALARKLHNGFLTDDLAARRTGEDTLGADRVRTTPHLVGWLVYESKLSDGDIPTIKADNRAFRMAYGYLGEFIDVCYEHALGLRMRKYSS